MNQHNGPKWPRNQNTNLCLGKLGTAKIRENTQNRLEIPQTSKLRMMTPCLGFWRNLPSPFCLCAIFGIGALGGLFAMFFWLPLPHNTDNTGPSPGTLGHLRRSDTGSPSCLILIVYPAPDRPCILFSAVHLPCTLDR